MHTWVYLLCKRNIEQSRKITEMKNNAISIHYGANSNNKQGCSSKEKAEAWSVGLWKAIRCGWDELWSRNNISVENRLKTKFWFDRWRGDHMLKDYFSSCLVSSPI